MFQKRQSNIQFTRQIKSFKRTLRSQYPNNNKNYLFLQLNSSKLSLFIFENEPILVQMLDIEREQQLNLLLTSFQTPISILLKQTLNLRNKDFHQVFRYPRQTASLFCFHQHNRSLSRTKTMNSICNFIKQAKQFYTKLLMQPQTNKKPLSHQSSSQAIDTQRSNSKIGAHINQLYNKFMTLNKQVSIEFDLSAFNIAEFQKQDSKLQYDSQMVQAKLKRLENNFELKKANFELQNRKKRSPKKKYPNAFDQQDSYLNIYNHYSSNTTKKLFKGENQSDSDQQGKKNEEPIKGINYSKELRKHPKFLQFTIDKMKKKELMQIEQKNEKTETLQKLKKQIKQVGHQRSLSKRKVEPDMNPQQLADNIFRKIYTKKNKEPPIEEAKTDRRVAKIIDRQDSILDTIDERSLSKQNYKKLKGRMNQIANELYMDDKKHFAKIFLPKLRLNNRSTLQHQQHL